MPAHTVVAIPSQPETATTGQVAPLAAQRLDAFRRLWRAQDSQPGQARRVLAEYSLGGALRWAVPEGVQNPTGFLPFYPLEGAWRTVGSFRGRLTAGCMLEAHVLYAPAGLVQRVNRGVYTSAGAWAELRVAVTWRNGGTTSGPHYWSVTMQGSPFGPYGGLAASTTPGLDWESLEERRIEAIRRPNTDVDDELAATYSEWSDVEIELQVQGGERIVHATVYEVPDRHVQRHDDGGPVSVHGAPSSDVPFPVSARTDAPDVGVFENHRMGTLRTARVAQRQGERFGPHVVAWSYTEHDEMPSSEPALQVGPSSTFVDVFDASFEGWDPEFPGWIVAGSTAQLHRLNGSHAMRGTAAVIPVTVWVDAEWFDDDQVPDGEAVVRLQSGPYEWVDVTFDVDREREVRRVYGYLESQVYGDHAAANLVVLARVGGAQLSLHGISVAFGHW